ncbi:MAG: response regulator [Candidatus Omnitrophota bacterium]|jgi:DNA-binding response OmpR family regulator|nr:MAG: response regulator [Candidatus Omnitrophota bacterium]
MPRLLIVDDELDVREFAANFFKKRKIDVGIAASGEEALKIVSEAPPQLILLDIKMEGIDGIETLKQIKKINPSTKVIMVTGKKPDEEESFNKCKEFGATDYIHKPLRLEELEKVVLKELS